MIPSQHTRQLTIPKAELLQALRRVDVVARDNSHRVVFRTSPYGALRDLSHPTEVAFEIDHVDEAAGTGWSVVVEGRAEGVVNPVELAAVWARPDLDPWAPGTRSLVVAITSRSTTGRVVRAPSAA